jgi:hypothetical protein
LQQVDYEKDARWMSWSEEALQRLLKRCGPPETGKVNASQLNHFDITQVPTTPSIPNSWYHPKEESAMIVTPSLFDTKQDLFNDDPIFGRVTQEMALEDDILDIEAVR